VRPGQRRDAEGFYTPLEKTEMFLTAPECQDSAAPSGLSDEAPVKSPATPTDVEEFRPRWLNPDITEQLETPRF